MLKVADPSTYGRGALLSPARMAHILIAFHGSKEKALAAHDRFPQTSIAKTYTPDPDITMRRRKIRAALIAFKENDRLA